MTPTILFGFFLDALILSFVLEVYLLPALVASKRQHRNTGAIFVLNLLTGWTLLGWVFALGWSLTRK